MPYLVLVPVNVHAADCFVLSVIFYEVNLVRIPELQSSYKEPSLFRMLQCGDAPGRTAVVHRHVGCIRCQYF
eukprot:2642004-Pyramimonas_sp.AAC.3